MNQLKKSLKILCQTIQIFLQDRANTLDIQKVSAESKHLSFKSSSVIVTTGSVTGVRGKAGK